MQARRIRAIIKICGITNLEDARAALAMGADWLGFNFYRPSPRYIEPKAAAGLIRQLPEGAVKVGVFVNAPEEEIGEICSGCSLEMVQLHGDESPDLCRKLAQKGLTVIKALRVRSREDLQQMQKYPTDMILLDAFREEVYGGTGRRFDWRWIRSCGGKKIILAGGIGPENIQQALEARTYGVDLCSGVEQEPRRKDQEKMKRLFEQIEAYYAATRNSAIRRDV